MGAFREFKSIWDPGNKLNPHKVVDAYLPTENLRLGADYAPLQPRTHFPFPDDGGSLAKATLRCVGLGECRKHDGGSMCPSYMVTLEEEHSTRGRAHMLFELLQGEVVRERLEGRARQACARPVPVLQGVQVRVPDQRRHRHLSRRVSVALLRGRAAGPLHAYAFGMVDRWLRLGSLAPGWPTFSRARPASVTRSGARCTWRPSGSCLDSPRSPSGSGRAETACETAGGNRSHGGGRRTNPIRNIGHASCCGSTRSTTTFTRRRARRRWRCCRRPAATSSFPPATVLRPAALRLRPARSGEGLPAIDPGRARRGDRRRRSARRARAELRVGVSRRAAQPVSDRCACRETPEPDVSARGVPRISTRGL